MDSCIYPPSFTVSQHLKCTLREGRHLEIGEPTFPGGCMKSWLVLVFSGPLLLLDRQPHDRSKCSASGHARNSHKRYKLQASNKNTPSVQRYISECQVEHRKVTGLSSHLSSIRRWTWRALRRSSSGSANWRAFEPFERTP